MSIKKSRVLIPGSGDICFTFNNNLINQNIDQAHILQLRHGFIRSAVSFSGPV